ncbi:hypothetical protein [Streptomyces melanogenes]|uniref:Lipoprotein n=1 Tax=Streptomyces melanogenes TaxID=67326 RepID=A0ABZ1XSI1_9ACTN|nr:hypothetical protein [Streptomyces melanogenes]
MRRPHLALTSIALLLCAACSGTKTDRAAESPAPDYGPTVRTAVTALGKSTAAFDEKVEIAGDGQNFAIGVKGRFDFAGAKGMLAVDFPEGGISHVDEVFASNKVYVRGAAGLDGEWGVIGRDKAEAHYLLRSPLNDPEHVLQQLSTMHKISKEGTEQVNGATAVRYHGLLGADILTLRGSAKLREQASQLRGVVGEIPMYADTWVDSQGRLVRARLRCDLGPGHVAVTVDFADHGKAVKVSVPGDATPVSSVSGVLTG